MRKKLLTTSAIVIGALYFPWMHTAYAAPDTILWVSDAFQVGEVDVTTQQVVPSTVKNTGVPLTGIGFNNAGKLFATSFTDLYSVNTATGAATHITTFPTSNGANGMNALVGAGANLLSASFTSNTVWSVNSVTGALIPFKTSPATSAGDLAFTPSALYESAFSGAAFSNTELVNLTTGTVVGLFHVGTASGPTLTDVFGIASDGTNVYAVAGTEVYSVNLATAVLTPLFNYALHENDQFLGAATDLAFTNEATINPLSAVPEPASLALLGLGVLGIGFVRRHRKR